MVRCIVVLLPECDVVNSEAGSAGPERIVLREEWEWPMVRLLNF